MTLTDYRTEREMFRFACPHCATVLEVPMDQRKQDGPCPRCWQPICAPELPGEEVVEAEMVRPFTAKRRMAPQTLESVDARMEVHRGRKKRHRRWRAFLEGFDSFLLSRFYQVARVVCGIGLVGMIGYTYWYMKKHGWQPWWKAPVEMAMPVASGTNEVPHRQ